MFRRTRIGLVLLAGVVVGGLAWRVSHSQEALGKLFATDEDALADQVAVDRPSFVRKATSQDADDDSAPASSKPRRLSPPQPTRSDLPVAAEDEEIELRPPHLRPASDLSDDEPPSPVADFDDPSVEAPPRPVAPPTSADLRQRLIYLTTKRSVRMSNEELDAAIKELSEQLDAQDQQAEAELQQVIERLQEIVKSFPGTPAAARAENALNAVKNPPTSDDFGGNDAIRPKQRM